MAEYIEREDAYNVLTEFYHHSTEVQHEALREAIERVPAADVQLVKHAMWKRIPEYTGSPWGYFECTNCGERSYTLSENYCPNCGAMMCGGEF